jgi:5-methylcytosine-specific restriction protein B
MGITDLLRGSTRETCDGQHPIARSDLAHQFPDNEWGIDSETSYYSEENIRNIWNNELRRGIKNKLEEEGFNQGNYTSWLGEVHFTTIEVYLKNLFDERYRKNAGWRIVLMAIPRAGAVLIGIASHYQNAQNHNKLGQVSNLLYDIASSALSNNDPQMVMYGRKISRIDWDQNGLLPNPISTIGDISILPEVIYLKDIRTTTLKKTLASFVTVRVLPNSIDLESLHSELTNLQAVAVHLYYNVYPFRRLDEFESFRALALQDIAAAATKWQLNQRSSSRSIVRVYYGPPGTGKTLSAVREAVRIIDPAFDANGDPSLSFERFNELKEQCAFVTFHPSLQYEDLVESIRPVLLHESEEPASDSDNEGNVLEQRDEDAPMRKISYQLHEGILLRMIRQAIQNPSKEYVVVADEINRGDISRILGPLISSLEPDKRIGAEYPIGIELNYPRSNELESRLFMPSNLHIIGTMNSSDRNIALVDHALRRRFNFVEIPPDPGKLGSTTDQESIDCSRLLRIINARIEHLLDSDHRIGHGYFSCANTNLQVIERLATKVIPLLREYFYGNEGLILLLLGDAANSTYTFTLKAPPEMQFQRLFGVGLEGASVFGYRPHASVKNIELDPRFWNPFRLVPGPDDEAYAVRCILKLCDSDSQPGSDINRSELDASEADEASSPE